MQIVPAHGRGCPRLVHDGSHPCLRGIGGHGDNGWLAVLRSDDGGATWTVPYPDPSLTQFKVGGGIDLGTQADRNLEIAVHPSNRDLVLLGSRRTGLLGSTDGGQTWDSGPLGRAGQPDLPLRRLVRRVRPRRPRPGTRCLRAATAGCSGAGRRSRPGTAPTTQRFPTLMFDQRSESTAPALTASSTFPGLLVGALQDNGNVFLSHAGRELAAACSTAATVIGHSSSPRTWCCAAATTTWTSSGRAGQARAFRTRCLSSLRASRPTPLRPLPHPRTRSATSRCHWRPHGSRCR